MNLKGKKILVTGSDGFIGSHLTEELVRRGFDVRAFVYYNSFNSWGWLDTSPSGWTVTVSSNSPRSCCDEAGEYVRVRLTPSISTPTRTNWPALKPPNAAFGRRVSVTLRDVCRRTSTTSARASLTVSVGRTSSR